MDLTLRVWRQKDGQSTGTLETYQISGIIPDMSFLEMLDVTNERLIEEGKEPIAFDHDCREGICGACSLVINGRAHGGFSGTTTCQLHMRKFNDGDTHHGRALAGERFSGIEGPGGGFAPRSTASSRRAGSSRQTRAARRTATRCPSPSPTRMRPWTAAACIGCGACAASCPNGSAMLFVAAKVSHLAHLPQGVPERGQRVLSMVAKMDEEGFGNCTNHAECEAMCPKDISISHIAKMNREFIRATVRGE